MKIAFWNIKQNKNLDYVVKLIDSVCPDVLFLAESSPEMVELLQDRYKTLGPGISSEPKIYGFIVSKNLKGSLIREYKDRLFLYQLTWQEEFFSLGVVHLPSKLYKSTAAQSEQVAKYVREIRMFEEELQHKNTILIGDFNMNPFEPGMVLASLFNSVCSPAIALKQKRTIDGEDYDYFFNPSWKNYAGVGNDVYGTYYYHACGTDEFHWNNLDQVLIRPSILQQYDPEFFVLHDVLEFDLRKRNNGISDHYPILLELKEK